MTDYDQFSSLDDLAKFVDFWFDCKTEVGNNPYTFHKELVCKLNYRSDKGKIIHIARKAGFDTWGINPYRVQARLL